MSIISNEMRFLGVNSSLVNLIEKKDSTNNEKTEYYSLDDIRGYKVYTALLTQSGGDDVITISSGAVTEGVTYIFNHARPPEPWDFSNVGGPVFPDANDFVATSSGIPNEYGTANLTYNAGAPVVPVLENTLGLNPTYNYANAGSYFLEDLAGLFTTNKTAVFMQFKNGGPTFEIWVENINQVHIGTDGQDNQLLNTFIEIRIYN